MRAIIHLDLDAFYAAVEVLEDPSLVGQPVIVGGQAHQRGVVVSASYPARAFGVRAAMPTARAIALCPGAIVLPPRHQLYSEYSRRVMAVLHLASSTVEQISIDEAFIDLSEELAAWEDAIEVARQLQRRVKEETGLSASLGLATNKLVAKVASDCDKPGGLTVVKPGDEPAFLAPLPVRVLWGVGPVTAQKLAGMGVATVGDLAQVPEPELMARFGRQGAAMARQALGIDRRSVVTDRDPKSVSQERTFARDLADTAALEHQLQRLSAGVSKRLKRQGVVAGTIALKVRYADFTTLTRQMRLAVPTDSEQLIYQASLTLLHRVWRQGQRVRLLGVGGHHLSPPLGQMPLLLDDTAP
jgi:DNA polymerase-4